MGETWVREMGKRGETQEDSKREREREGERVKRYYMRWIPESLPLNLLRVATPRHICPPPPPPKPPERANLAHLRREGPYISATDAAISAQSRRHTALSPACSCHSRGEGF